jgi:hypothetical protein
MVWDGENIIRINTQDGTMERCDKATLKCAKVENQQHGKETVVQRDRQGL